MDPEASPFTPGQPVPIEFFVGRIPQIEYLRGMVRASLQGRFKIGFVTGERGIGKSSLVSFVRYLVEREDPVAGTHVFLGGVSELPEMIWRTFDRLLKESTGRPWYTKVLDFFGDNVRQVGLFGISVELDLSQKQLKRIVRDFVPSVRQLVSQLGEDRACLLVILDDVNGLAQSAGFASWLKSTVDEIATSADAFPVCILVVGLEDVRQRLAELQPSLARVFELVEIQPWSQEETVDFYRTAFDSVAMEVEGKAMETLVSFTGGLPVFGHEIGDAIYRVASEPTITDREARVGVLTAADVIGRKLLEPQVFRAIRSGRYRSILRKLASGPFEFSFKRSEVRKRLSAEEKRVLDNFLNRMKKLGALVADEEMGPGGYRFANRLHHLYFRLEATRAKRSGA